MTASSEVLTALAAWPQPIQAQACLAAIFEGEGGVSFRTLFGSGKLLQPANPNIQVSGNQRLWTGSLASFPDWGGAELADGTVTHAAGAGQDEPATVQAVAALSGITGFEPADQLNLNWFLASHDFAARGGGNLLAELVAGHPELVPVYLVKVWPGGADSGFAKRYANNMAALQAMALPPPPPPPPPPPYAGFAPVKLSLALTIAPAADGKSLEVALDQAAAS